MLRRTDCRTRAVVHVQVGGTLRSSGFRSLYGSTCCPCSFSTAFAASVIADGSLQERSSTVGCRVIAELSSWSKSEKASIGASGGDSVQKRGKRESRNRRLRMRDNCARKSSVLSSSPRSRKSNDDCASAKTPILDAHSMYLSYSLRTSSRVTVSWLCCRTEVSRERRSRNRSSQASACWPMLVSCWLEPILWASPSSAVQASDERIWCRKA